MKAEHVFRKFPNHIEAIRILLQEDASFREMCADYEEICTWLDTHDRVRKVHLLKKAFLHGS